MGVTDQPFGFGPWTGTDRGHSFRMRFPGDSLCDFGGQAEDAAERVDDEVVGGHVIVMDEDGPRLLAGGVNRGISIGTGIGLDAAGCFQVERGVDAPYLVAGLG